MNGEWIKKPKGLMSVVFVHGILSSGETCWRSESGSYWPELLSNEMGFEDLGIYVYTYETGIFSGSYRLSDVVDDLKERMRVDGIFQSKQIMFVCHSMGGIVVRKFLVERSTYLLERKLKIKLFLVASPSLGSSYANWLSPLAKLFGHSQAEALRFTQNNAWLNDLDKEFTNLKESEKLDIEGKEIIEDNFVTLKKLWFLKQVVPPFSGARYFGDRYKVPQSDHFSIAKPENKDAMQHRVLCQFIKDVSQTTDESPLVSDAKVKPAQRIFLSKLPNTSPDVFGREKELEVLDKAWEDPHTKILSFVAWGGVGKSALINAWLNKMDEQSYYDAELVYGWSFYSQGTKEKGQASTDVFFNDAFKWFGYTGEIPKMQHEKGRLLAEIISKQKTLLILDGLEPLQYPPGEMHGFLKDKTITGLLKNLVRNMNGLCIITSRCNVEDLQTTEGRSSVTQELENLSEQAGMTVLKSYSLKGKDKEFTDTSNEFKGHSLALHLVGSYLKAFHDADIRKRDLIPKLTEDEKHGGHARRVMESYEKWFAETNKAELDVLNLLGLFDRPAVKEAIDVIKKEPAIKGLTDRLQHLSNSEWQLTLNHLRELHLISRKDDQNPETLDCHPLIREHFGEKLEKQNPDGWKEAHTRLYEYYKNLPEKEFPETLEEMEPLFAAVKHGCLASKYHEALNDVYVNRIKRGADHYLYHQIGAYGADLSCLSVFFETLWDTPSTNFKEDAKAYVSSCAGFTLRAVGWLAEASVPMKAALEATKKSNDWKSASRNAYNLSELYLTLGKIIIAEQYGEQSVTFSDRSGDYFEMEKSRCARADVMHQAGKIKVAENIFIETENMQKKFEPDYPFLYTLLGFKYCDLLISMGRYNEVVDRAKITLEWAKSASIQILDLALDKITIGMALIFLENLSDSEKYLNQAVDGLREAGTQHHLPRGLLARATLSRHQENFLESWKDLEEVREIAEYGGMRLYLTDYNLEAARVIKAQVDNDNTKKEFTIIEDGIEKDVSKEEMAKLFKEHVAKAGKLIEETGYHRRDKELEELKK